MEGDRIDTQKPFKKVGTHHGRFHADEVMATAILKEIFDIDIIRTRDPNVLKGLDLVYDVGGGEFDHHDMEKEYRDNGIPYAACGLIWREFGRDVILSRNNSLTDEEVEAIYRYVDYALVEGIDAVDNGIRTGENIVPTMSISSIISGFNPSWDSDTPEDESFYNAVNLAHDVFGNTLNQKFSTVRARAYVVEAYNNRHRPEVMVLDSFYPWISTLRDIDKNGEVLFVIYPGREGYIIHTVREKGSYLKARKDLPESWAGKRDKELGSEIGIDDAIFCHPGRFIAGAGSLDSTMIMADIAVSQSPETLGKRVLAALRKLFKGQY